jgi:hypothetical protein
MGAEDKGTAERLVQGRSIRLFLWYDDVGIKSLLEGDGQTGQNRLESIWRRSGMC